MAERITQISDYELLFHAKLLDRLNKATAAELSVRGQLQKAQQELQTTNEMIQEWMDHLGAQYGLKERDAIDGQGVIHYLDPQWAFQDYQEHVRPHEADEPKVAVPQESKLEEVSSDPTLDPDFHHDVPPETKPKSSKKAPKVHI